jgi:hypothetical protein
MRAVGFHRRIIAVPTTARAVHKRTCQTRPGRENGRAASTFILLPGRKRIHEGLGLDLERPDDFLPAVLPLKDLLVFDALMFDDFRRCE